MTTEADVSVDLSVEARLDADESRRSVTVESAINEREQRARILVVQRLHRSFPSVPLEQIEAMVQAQYRRFNDSRIRDFVPIFVERGAREQLAALRPP